MERKTPTLDVIAAAKGHELVIAGEMVDLEFPAGTGLSLRAAKAFLAMLDLAGARIADDVEHSAPLREIVPGGHRATEDLEGIVDELHGTKIKFTYVDRAGQRRRKSTVLVAEVDRPLDTDTAEIRWRYSNAVRQLVRMSHHWAAIQTQAVMAMECKYSPWLYQLVALHAGRRAVSQEWPLNDLRARLGATAPSLKRWQDFKRWVLEPAVAEINHLTGVRVDWLPVKRGRAVVAVQMACMRKQAEDIAETAVELSRHKVGRRARRDGLVEELVEERRQIAAALDAQLRPDERKT